MESTENVHGVQIGDIFYTCWGYEQTNVDFYEVVAVTPKMAMVKPIRSHRTETGWLQGNAEPIPGAFIIGGWAKDVIRTRTANWGDGPRLTNADGHDHAGCLYGGEPLCYSCYA